MEKSVFSTEASKAISDEYLAVRLTGGRDITPEVQDFMGKYSVRGYPTIFVMNADGHVVNGRVGRTAEGMLKALADGEKAEVEYRELKGKEDAASKTKLARLLIDRALQEEAEELLEELAETAPSADVHEALAYLYRKQQDPDAETEKLQEMLGLYPKADKRNSWRIRLAFLPMESADRASGPEIGAAVITSLGELSAEFEKGGDTNTAAEVRETMARLSMMIGKADEAVQHIDWVLANAKDSEYAPKCLMHRANVKWRAKDFEGCKGVLEQILEDYPESEDAKRAPGGIKNCEKQMGG